MLSRVGTTVSIAIDTLPVRLALPEASVKAPAGTVTVPTPVVLMVGVKVAVYSSGFPSVCLKLEIVPLVATTSVAMKLAVALERVKVIVAVSPAFSDALSLVMIAVGAMESIATVSEPPAVLALPAASANAPAGTPMTTELKPAVGVRVAV